MGLVRNIISFSSEKVLLSGVAYTITLVYIVCLILTYLLGESVQAHGYLLWEAFFLIIILLVNFFVAFNEEYLYRNEIPHRVRKVLGKCTSYLNCICLVISAFVFIGIVTYLLAFLSEYRGYFGVNNYYHPIIFIS